MAKKTSAVAEAVMNRSETKAATTTGASTPSLSRKAMPSRARSAEWSAALRLAAGAQRLRRHRDGQEARGVDQQRDARAAGGREQAAEDGAEGEAEVAGRLDAPVGRRHAAGPGRGGHQRELGRLRQRDPDAEQRREGERRRQAAEGQRQHGRDRRLPERDVAQQAPALDAVGEQPRRPAEDDRGRPQRDEQPGDRDPRPRALLHIERQRDEAEEVAQRGEAHRAGEQTAIAHAQAPAAACIICAACSIVFVRSCAGENSMRSASSSTTTLWPAGR